MKIKKHDPILGPLKFFYEKKYFSFLKYAKSKKIKNIL
jgi:hypothetical protein